MHNYYQIATNILVEASKFSRAVMTVIKNRLKGICKKGRKLTPTERIRYGRSAIIRYLAGEPIYPIGYVQHKIPMNKSYKTDCQRQNAVCAERCMYGVERRKTQRLLQRVTYRYIIANDVDRNMPEIISVLLDMKFIYIYHNSVTLQYLQ